MAIKNFHYIDISSSFVPHPITGDLTVIRDEPDVGASIVNLISTNHYDMPFQPWVGGHITALLFEPNTSITQHAIKKRIIDTISKYEPRAEVVRVDVNFLEINNGYNIKIEFKVVGRDRPTTVDVILRRTR